MATTPLPPFGGGPAPSRLKRRGKHLVHEAILTGLTEDATSRLNMTELVASLRDACIVVLSYGVADRAGSAGGAVSSCCKQFGSR